ncbi:uncharacterized protein LOC127732359 [Mytilus californianus]|uniref:uncharacterized protein LOC127732359 n=1 Tax=Mytilus californianus TaxID=6549 RepID=UPI0022470C9F|nr:uncharacterized protein LOC127732359 [Mytilus californianus]
MTREQIIKEVLKLANRTPNAVPTRTVDNIIVEKIAIGQKQLELTVGAQQDTCLYGDETRKFGKTYQTFLLSDDNKQVYFLGLRDMHDKAASTTLDMFANILDDISDICETYRNNDITSHGHSILSNIRNFMSDRAQTNIAFTELLQNYRTEIMPTFLQNWNELTIGEQTSTVKLIVAATEGPSEERVARDVPLFVGKKVLHTFKEGKWNGRVLSVVKGFPEFYNIVYDCDLDESTATISSATAIYTYKLKQEYRDGNLEILPEADITQN